MRMRSMASFYSFKSTNNNAKIHLDVCAIVVVVAVILINPLSDRSSPSLSRSLTRTIHGLEFNNVALKSYAFYSALCGSMINVFFVVCHKRKMCILIDVAAFGGCGRLNLLSSHGSHSPQRVWNIIIIHAFADRSTKPNRIVAIRIWLR